MIFLIKIKSPIQYHLALSLDINKIFWLWFSFTSHTEA